MSANLASAKLLLNSSAKKVLQKVDSSERKRVQKALEIFTRDPLDVKIRFERYTNQANLYSIRATHSLRIFMVDTGRMEMQIVHVGNHDFVKKIR